MSNVFTDVWRLTADAAAAGFEFTSSVDAALKLTNEYGELYEELTKAKGLKSAIHEELGDCLFVLVNIARYLSIDPEYCLDAAAKKFSRRVRAVAELARAQGADPDNLPLAQWKELWAQVKAQEGEG